MDSAIQSSIWEQSPIVSQFRWWVWVWKIVLAVSGEVGDILLIYNKEQLEKFRNDLFLIQEWFIKAGIIYKGGWIWDFSNAKNVKNWPRLVDWRRLEYFFPTPVIKRFFWINSIGSINNLKKVFISLWFTVIDNNEERKLLEINQIDEIEERNEKLRELLINVREELSKAGIIFNGNLELDFSNIAWIEKWENIKISWRRLVMFPCTKIIREAWITTWVISSILNLIKMFIYLWFTVIDSNSHLRKEWCKIGRRRIKII